MPRRLSIGIDEKTFKRLSAVYRQRWNIPLCATAPSGEIVLGAGAVRLRKAGEAARKLAIESAVRWGEPTVEPHPGGRLVWAVPLMLNAKVIGGVLAAVEEAAVFSGSAGTPGFNIRSACADLRQIVEQANLTNEAYLSARREEYRREQSRAQAIHEFKIAPHDDVRGMYLHKEPELLAAIRRDDRPAAREIMNSMLVAMLHRAGESLNLIKTFFMELVVMMCRTAVEAGGKPEELLGTNFQSLLQLAEIRSDEQLAPWLHDILDHVMDSIGNLSGRPAMVPVGEALKFMESHLGEDISRDDIARAAHLSPHHFSRLFRREIGRSCGDMLNKMRVDRAAELIARTDSSLAAVAIDCGFRDQSYFTKVFCKYMGVTPRKYRNRHHEQVASEKSAEKPI